VLYWTTNLIDQVIERGSCDLATDIATPLPATVSLEWLGMPADVLGAACSSYHEYLGYPPGTPESERGYQNVAWLNERIEQELDARRDAPRDDLLSWLVHSDLGEGPLPFDEVVRMTIMLVAAGIDTTSFGHFFDLPAARQGEGMVPGFLASHPDSGERSAMIAREGKPGGDAMDAKDWKHLQNICRKKLRPEE